MSQVRQSPNPSNEESDEQVPADGKSMTPTGPIIRVHTSPSLVAEVGGGPPPPPAQGVAGTLTMRYLVRALVKYKASDLHLKVGRPPLLRVNGKLVPTKIPELNQAQMETIVYGVMNTRHREELERSKQVDLSFVIKTLGRFRANIFYQRNTIGCVVRMIPLSVPRLEDLGVPIVMKELCQRPRGLILVTGATGSGKSTTLAAMIQHINEISPVHILTLEDPIEFQHSDIKSTVTQREVGNDCLSFKDGLYAGLRQDPDVIMIGELRDYQMIQLALSAAESGHLVLSTLHTNDARSTIDRMIEVFPPEAQNQARIQLSSSLLAVFVQQLLVRADGSGRVSACEVMINSPTIASYILKHQLEKIPEAIAGSVNYYQMQTMNQSLERLVRAGVISAAEALQSSSSSDDLKLSLSGLKRDEGYQMAGAFSEESIEPPVIENWGSGKHRTSDDENK
jgi:twitching motility protein PilT